MQASTRRLSRVASVGAAAMAVACGSSGSSGAVADSGADVDANDASLVDAADSGPAVEAGPVMDAAAEASDGGADAAVEAGPAAPLGAGTTGAFGVVTVDGKQKIYLPSNTVTATGNATVAAVDVGVVGAGIAGAPALVKSVDLGTTAGATTTAGDATMVVAAATTTNDVWFIDPTTDTVVKHLSLDATYGRSGFSSGGGYVTGIAVDPATHTAVLGVWNGFAILDLTTQTITKVIPAPPSENFGFDSLHHYVYAPFYDCSSSMNGGTPPAACASPMTPEGGIMPAGLSVIDLSDGNVYTYEDPAAPDPRNPLGFEPDSAGVDPVTQIVMVPAENEGYENILDFSKASFDKSSKTVKAPHAILMPLQYEGVAIEPVTHLAFFEGEGSAGIALAKSIQASAGDQGYVSGTMPTLPGGGGQFDSVADPHGIAATPSIINGKPVGFLVDSGLRWLARVDLSGVAALEQSGTEVKATTGQVQAAVTFLDTTTIE